MKKLITSLRTPITILSISLFGLLTYSQPSNPLSSFAQETVDTEIMEISVVEDSVTSWADREEWTAHVVENLPSAMCENLDSSNQEIGISTQKCQELVTVEVQECLQTKGVPEQLAMPEDGVKWGTVIGECAGTNYLTALRTVASKS